MLFRRTLIAILLFIAVIECKTRHISSEDHKASSILLPDNTPVTDLENGKSYYGKRGYFPYLQYLGHTKEGYQAVSDALSGDISAQDQHLLPKGKNLRSAGCPSCYSRTKRLNKRTQIKKKQNRIRRSLNIIVARNGKCSEGLNRTRANTCVVPV